MTTQEQAQAKLIAAHKEGKLITCRFPYGSDMLISLERHMVEQGFASWKNIPEPDHGRVLSSINRSIKHVVKRMRKGKATGPEMDAMAADISLWLAHRLMFADGEKYLQKGPSREDLENAMRTSAQA